MNECAHLLSDDDDFAKNHQLNVRTMQESVQDSLSLSNGVKKVRAAHLIFLVGG